MEKYRLTTKSGNTIIVFNELDLNDNLPDDTNRKSYNYSKNGNRFTDKKIVSLIYKKWSRLLYKSYEEISHSIKKYYVDRENHIFYYGYY